MTMVIGALLLPVIITELVWVVATDSFGLFVVESHGQEWSSRAIDGIKNDRLETNWVYNIFSIVE
ncbi:hypothetical protein ACFQMM_14910 [Saliphagus sp. GCM10025308]